MGALRNVAKTIMTFLFSLFLTLFILTLFFYNITTYENTKNIFISVYTNAIVKNTTTREIENLYSNLSSYCEMNSSATFTIMENVILNCNEILGKNSTYLIYLIAEKSFDNFYYKEYECEFIECIKNIKSNEDVAVFFSLTAHKFFSKIIQPLLIASIVTGIVLFVLIETWGSRFKIFGLEFLSIGIFFFILPYFKGFILEKIVKNALIGENILDLIFDQLSSIFLIFLILGVVLIVGWVLTKIFVKKSK